MARIKNSGIRTITIKECEYLKLLEDHIILNALIKAGIEQMAIYKVAETIIEDERIEIHKEGIQRRYK